MKLAVNRPPCDSGFTLAEMLLILLLLSVLLLVTPLLKWQQRILLRMDVQQIREICIKAQVQTIREHKSILIKIQGSKVYCDREIYSLQSSISCSSMSSHYTAQGTVSKAFTLNCRNTSSIVQLVTQLGSGHMDVRQAWCYFNGGIVSFDDPGYSGTVLPAACGNDTHDA